MRRRAALFVDFTISDGSYASENCISGYKL
jgi:hypothetical protein